MYPIFFVNVFTFALIKNYLTEDLVCLKILGGTKCELSTFKTTLFTLKQINILIFVQNYDVF